MKTDIEIARSVKTLHIREIGAKLGITEDNLDFYGQNKAKIPLKYIDEEKIKKSNLILVTAMTPTPAGEGKTTVSIGLAQAMNLIGTKTTVVLREPSLGPVFGIKGGAAGGGWSQVLPMEDINLHFTGDLGAIEKAHNLLSALVDNNLQQTKRSLGIDPRTIVWKRVMDMNERALRHIIVGLGGEKQGVPRETGFDITAASEVMATLCLANSLQDLKEKLGNIYIGLTYDGKPVYARDLKANGAMATLLKDAIKPNLVQTIEHTPAIIHGGPFANIAQGTNSIIATKMGLSLSDYVVTEAGFASDLGAEKFFDIKCQYGGLEPKTVVIVATIRALKHHGGVKKDAYNLENVEAVKKGLENLDKHIENMKKYGLTPIVAINKFVSDTVAEIQTVQNRVKIHNIKAIVADVWGEGGKGAEELAKEVVKVVSDYKGGFEPLYNFEMFPEDKIERIVKDIYGAEAVEYSLAAKKVLKQLELLNMDKVPVCIAKTQNSFSDNRKLLGRPSSFTVKIRDVEINSGAGFIVPIAGPIMRMPGLPSVPSAESIDIDAEGNISGLF